MSTDIQRVVPRRQFFAGLAYENIADADTRSNYFEGYFRNVLATIFAVLNKNVEPEVQSSSGRVDLVVKVKDWTFIFELKMLRDGQEADAFLDAALRQALDEKRCAERKPCASVVCLSAFGQDFLTMKPCSLTWVRSGRRGVRRWKSNI